MARPPRTPTQWVLLLVPQALLAAGMLVMLVAHPNAVKSGVMSTRAVLVNAVLLGTWLVISFVILPRLIRNDAARSGILTALALLAIAVLVVPTLRDTTVNEKFPEVAVIQDRSEPVTTAPTSAGTPDAAPTTTVPLPVRVATGRLVGIDHDASGVASVYRQPDGSLVVGLESIDVEPGPDYHVYVVRGRDRRAPGDGTELAKLKGNQGTQYYEVPDDAGDVGDGWTVLIWCRAFGVPVAAATQSG
jgi:hypothetical protein